MSRTSRTSSPTTPATLALTRAGIPFTPHVYEHRAGATGFGVEAAAALGLDERQVFKTLVVQVDDALAVAVVPVATRLDLRLLAAVMGRKTATLADPAVAERRTGYVVGGIAPVGQRTALPSVIDASAERWPTVFVSGGRRGFDIELAPADLVRATGGRFAPIAQT